MMRRLKTDRSPLFRKGFTECKSTKITTTVSPTGFLRKKKKKKGTVAQQGKPTVSPKQPFYPEHDR
jgi:hypothetical protein